MVLKPYPVEMWTTRLARRQTNVAACTAWKHKAHEFVGVAFSPLLRSEPWRLRCSSFLQPQSSVLLVTQPLWLTHAGCRHPPTAASQPAPLNQESAASTGTGPSTCCCKTVRYQKKIVTDFMVNFMCRQHSHVLTGPLPQCLTTPRSAKAKANQGGRLQPGLVPRALQRGPHANPARGRGREPLRAAAQANRRRRRASDGHKACDRSWSAGAGAAPPAHTRYIVLEKGAAQVVRQVHLARTFVASVGCEPLPAFERPMPSASSCSGQGALPVSRPVRGIKAQVKTPSRRSALRRRSAAAGARARMTGRVSRRDATCATWRSELPFFLPRLLTTATGVPAPLAYVNFN